MTLTNWLTRFKAIIAQATVRATEVVAIESPINSKEITKEGTLIGKERTERERSTLTLMIQAMLQKTRELIQKGN